MGLPSLAAAATAAPFCQLFGHAASPAPGTGTGTAAPTAHAGLDDVAAPFLLRLARRSLRGDRGIEPFDKT